MSKEIVSVSDISAVNSNLTVGWKLFAFKRNSSILSLFVSHIVQPDAPNDRFLSNALKLCRLILDCVNNVLSDRLFLGNLNILEFIRLFSPFPENLRSYRLSENDS